MKIIGIDPGLATVGIGIVEADDPQTIEPLDWFTIETKAGLPIHERLLEISDDLSELLEEEKPDLVVVEKIFFSVNEKTALDVAQARGVILQCIADQEIPLMEITPMQLKQCITGDGSADKRQIQDMLVRMLNLNEIPTPDDAADALGMAVYGVVNNVLLSPSPL